MPTTIKPLPPNSPPFPNEDVPPGGSPPLPGNDLPPTPRPLPNEDVPATPGPNRPVPPR